MSRPGPGNPPIPSASGNSGYANPLRGIRGLVPSRVDMGVDYSGSGPVYALGPGRIYWSSTNSGWPGGGFVGETLESGPFAGKNVYVAEDVTPTVRVGQHVTANTKIANLHGSMETGWAASSVKTDTTMASQTGEDKAGLAHGDAGFFPTAFGVSYNNLIKSLGGKPGLVNGPIQGQLPNNWPNATGITATLTSSPFGSVGGALLGGVGSGIVNGLASALGVTDWKDYLERVLLVLVGLIFILIGIYKLSGADSIKAVIPGPGQGKQPKSTKPNTPPDDDPELTAHENEQYEEALAAGEVS